MRWRSVAPAVAIALLGIAFVVAASRVGDPALRPGAFAVGDRRAHRYGSLPYARTAAVLARLGAERDAATDPAQRALLCARLSDVYAARQLFDDARREIQEALRLAPEASPVLVRAALVEHARGDDAAARALLYRAQNLDPTDPEVARATSFIRGVSPAAEPAEARESHSE
jgi:tetratricopeptide (TPR) repeat protein